MNYSLILCKYDGFMVAVCALMGYQEAFKPGNVSIRFVFWKDNSSML